MFKHILRLTALTVFITMLATINAAAQTGEKITSVRSFLTNTETEVVKELNFARTNPKKYAAFLRTYLSHINGDKYQLPGGCPLYLHEGKKAVEEAIQFLENLAPMKPFKGSKTLSTAAKDHALEQGRTGETGHYGANGSTIESRIEKHAQWLGSIGENCHYGSDVARDIVIDLIIDDGIADRGHRNNIFSSAFTAVGVAVVDHSKYGTVCVQDFAADVKAR